MMPGVVSIIDGAAGEYARHCWDLLGRELGIKAAPAGAVPHVTYHVSDGPYCPGPLLEEIEQLAAATVPFEVSSTGLGVFAGDPAVLYLAVTRTDALAQLQQKVWRTAERHATGSAEYWRQERWVPHITLAMEGLTTHLAARAMALLLPSARPLTVRIENAALIDEQTGAHQVVRRWEFAARMVQE